MFYQKNKYDKDKDREKYLKEKERKFKKTFEKKPKNYDAPALLRYAIWLLSKRDYSILKMKEKLSTKTDNQNLINETINKLVDNHYLDDNRKAQSIIRQYSSKESGYKLINRLKLAGIDKDIIDEEFIQNDELQDKELLLENCLKLLKSKFKKYDPDNYNKYIRLLISKGFDLTIIKKAISSFKNDSYEYE